MTSLGVFQSPKVTLPYTYINYCQILYFFSEFLIYYFMIKFYLRLIQKCNVFYLCAPMSLFRRGMRYVNVIQGVVNARLGDLSRHCPTWKLEIIVSTEGTNLIMMRNFIRYIVKIYQVSFCKCYCKQPFWLMGCRRVVLWLTSFGRGVPL